MAANEDGSLTHVWPEPPLEGNADSSAAGRRAGPGNAIEEAGIPACIDVGAAGEDFDSPRSESAAGFSAFRVGPPHGGAAMRLAPFGGSLLEPVPVGQRVGIRFADVCGWVPASFEAPGLTASVSRGLSGLFVGEEGEHGGKKQILNSITGGVSPGEVLAIMGPSGSGKTTFITVMGGRGPKSLTIKGDILFNGRALNKAMKRRIGFVLQDDLMFESLTVEETLYYAAMLRLPKTMSRKEKLRRVNNVIMALNISKCRDTLIGGFTMRGVSGGERKRVSVGHELLTNPSVVLLDEPTSGLDATTAMHLLTTLRELAEGGRSIVTTIHQPASRLYQQLDHVMLLSEGQVMYYGAADLALSWFGHIGQHCPPGVNIADFMLDLSNGMLNLGGRPNQKKLDDMVAKYKTFHASHRAGLQSLSQLDEPDRDHIDRLDRIDRIDPDLEDAVGSPCASPRSSLQPLAVESEGPGLGAEWGAAGGDKWGAGFVDQVGILFQRALKTRRFESLSWQNFAQMLTVAVVIGMLWYDRGGKHTLLSANDMTGLLFFELIFIAFVSMFAALFSFPAIARMLVKERASGMYRLSAFYIAHSASNLPMDCLIPSLFVTILYWLSGLRPTVEGYLSNWGLVILVALVAQSFGMLIGASVMNIRTAQATATVMMLTFMLASGFYVRDVPLWIGWIRYGSFSYYGFNVALKVEFSGRLFDDCGGLADEGTEGEPTECEPIDDIGEALSLPTDVEAPAYPQVLALVGMLVGARMATYYVLKRKTRG